MRKIFKKKLNYSSLIWSHDRLTLSPLCPQDKHLKEHILCSADDHKMNRHHYAWFVRNCRLILLLRRDFSEGDLNIFRPAEWRWKIPQVRNKFFGGKISQNMTDKK